LFLEALVLQPQRLGDGRPDERTGQARTPAGDPNAQGAAAPVTAAYKTFVKMFEQWVSSANVA
jgi:hypothetical protein